MDDELVVLGPCGQALRGAGHDVDEAADAERALVLMESHAYDVGMFDWKLPGMDGLELAHRAREHRPRMGILMLSRYAAPCDQWAALEAVADDYLLKPFAVEELRARVVAIARRSSRPFEVYAKLVWLTRDSFLDAKESRVVHPATGTSIDLSKQEIAILHLLAVRRPDYVSTREIVTLALARVDSEGAGAVLAWQYLSRLRKKLAPHGISIKRRRLHGYRIK